MRRDRHRRDEREAVVGVDPRPGRTSSSSAPNRLVQDAVAEPLERAGGVPDLDAGGARPRRDDVHREEVVVDDDRRARRRGGSPRAGCRGPARGGPSRPPAAQRQAHDRRPPGGRARSSSSMNRRLPVSDGRVAGGEHDPRARAPRSRPTAKPVRARIVREDAAATSSAGGRRAGMGPMVPTGARDGTRRGYPVPAMQIHAIILAGGDGNRFGGELPKQFVRLAGEPDPAPDAAAAPRRADRAPGGRLASALDRGDATPDRRGGPARWTWRWSPAA